MLKKILRYLSVGLLTVSGLVGLAVWCQECILLFPIPLAQNHRYKFAHGVPFEELFFKQADSVTLNALHFTVPQPRGLIFYLHGNASNLQRYGKFASDFTQKGYNVLMYDYRNFGKSRGKLSEASFYADAQWLYDTVLARYGYEQQQVVVYGRSLGSGIAAKLAAQNRPLALMLETPYYNIADVARRRAPFLPYERWLRYHFRTDLWIKQVKCPIYIFHGTHDGVVPYASGEQLKPYVANPQHFITIPRGRHNNLRTFEQYHQALSAFLQELNAGGGEVGSEK